MGKRIEERRGTKVDSLVEIFCFTKSNASSPLIDACRLFIYPEEDLQEVKGLLKALNQACKKANLKYQILKGPRELQEGTLGFFEPFRIQLPFKKAILWMHIGPGEFQWILRNARKEKGILADQLESFKKELLIETKEWLKRGNR